MIRRRTSTALRIAMRSVLAAGGALAVALGGLSPAVAQPGGWSPPAEISSPDDQTAAAQQQTQPDHRYASSWFPDLAIDQGGGVHIIWNSGIIEGDTAEETIDLLLYRARQGGAWSKIHEVAMPGKGGYTVRNSLAVGRDGRLHVLLRENVRIASMSAPLPEAWSARAWSKPATISGSGAAYYDELAADGRGGLHAVWTEAVPDTVESGDPSLLRSDAGQTAETCRNCSDLYYRRSSDGGQVWSAPQNLSRSLDGENRPQIMVDRADRLHLVWDQGVDWYAGGGEPRYGVYRRSDDGGATWTAPTFFGLGGDAVQQTALAVTDAGDPFVVFRSVKRDRLYFQRSRDGGDTWEPPQEVPGVRARNIGDNNLDRYSLAADGADHVHLVMVGFPDKGGAPSGDPSLLHLSYDGVAWSVPDAIMEGDQYPEWPQLVIAGGNHMHVAWFTRGKEGLFAAGTNGARYRVWYSERMLAAPPASPPPLFTAVSTAAPTAAVTPTVAPSPTPLPPAARQAPPLEGPPAWELPGLLAITLSLLPALGLVAVVAALRRRKER